MRSSRREAAGIIRLVSLRARAGFEEALHGALQDLAAAIAKTRGCRKVRLLSSLDDPARFALYEEWTSLAAHKKAAGALPPAVLSKLSGLLAQPMKGDYYAGSAPIQPRS
jgi:quinol monooxygenase YgiN